MKIKIQEEEDILNIDVRKQIIKEIHQDEEQERREAKFKEYMMIKGRNYDFIHEKLKELYSEATMEKIKYAITDIPINKKIIHKLARVYNNGASREINGNDEQTMYLEALSELLNVNTNMRALNEGLRQSYNMAMFVKPYKIDGKWNLDLIPLYPFLYSVVEHKQNRKVSMVHILSDFQERKDGNYSLADNPRKSLASMERTSVNDENRRDYYQQIKGNGQDELIADSYLDQFKDNIYTFWSKNYHFITNVNGEILSKESKELIEGEIPEEELKNPIEFKTIIDFTINTDNSFWSTEYNNLCHSDIMLNCMLTNLNHISTVQGYGKFFMKGSNLPEFIVNAPDIAVKLEYDEGDPVPEIGYVNSTPQINELRDNVEMLLGMILSTNNCSVSSIKTNLNSNVHPSGVSKILDMAESTEDVEDQKQTFYDKEIEMWLAITKWLKYLNQEGELEPKLAISMLNEEEVSNKFNINFKSKKPVMTESDHLANIKTRKEIGLNTMPELIQMDRENVSIDEAERKYQEIMKKKTDKMKSMVNFNQARPDEEEDENEGEQDGIQENE